jgi:hypothetical protein
VTLRQQFDAAEYVELVVTAAFYTMVPQVVSALRVPVEDRHAVPRPDPGVGFIRNSA